MTLLARKTFTFGDTTQYTVDYGEVAAGWYHGDDPPDPTIIHAIYPLRDGDSIATATAVSSAGDVTVGTVTVFEGHKVVFKLSGGSLNETFTITVTNTTSTGEVIVDTIAFSIVAP